MAFTSTSVLVVTAALELWRYQLSARLRGASWSRAAHVLQRWSRSAWRWLGLEVQIHGAAAEEPRLYVSNHRSYLDIPVLSGVLGASFLSRADVATWPIVGAAATAVGTVFVDRDDPRDRVRAVRALLTRIGRASLVVFPEGTTTGERLPGRFHEGLFRLLHRLDVLLVPVTVRYSHRRAYWIDDISLGRHLRDHVLAAQRLVAAVHIGQGIRPRDHATSEALAATTYAAVCRPIEAFGELV